MSKSITKLFVPFATAICFTSVLGTTITRSQPVTPENCSSLSKSKEALTIDKAIEDASKPEDCERSTNLMPIIKDNPRLIWNDDGQVLMVTWKGDCDSGKKNISCKKIDEIYPVEKENDLWVTAVPELKEFVLIQDYLVKQNKIGSNLSSGISYRLKQYLGLKPNSNYTNFVEIWVDPKDLIRPCLSSKVQVNDPQCAKDTPHPSKDGYPFTGLGYTYDWGNPNTDIGASEFIVRKDAIVTIHDIKSTSEYLEGLTPNLQRK